MDHMFCDFQVEFVNSILLFIDHADTLLHKSKSYVEVE